MRWKPETVGIYLFIILIMVNFVTLFMVTLLVKFGVSAIAYYKFGNLSFNIDELIESLRIGLSGGIPLGIGCWILSKMEENKRKKEQADKEADK